jgi:micrococcal nuclease
MMKDRWKSNKRWSYCIICIILFVSNVLLGCTDKVWAPSSDETFKVYVSRIIDGDTIRIILPDGSEDTLRILGIDCPELSSDSNKPFEYGDIIDMTCLMDFGSMAKSFTNDLIINKEILIEFDVSAGFTDTYGRLLAYVYTLNETDVGALLIQNGFARVYIEEDFSKEHSYLLHENGAKLNRTGLWGCSEKEQYGVQILLVHYDAMSDDRTNLNDEYVCITYRSNETNKVPVNLTGCTLSDDDGYVFLFPNSFVIDEGMVVTIHSGVGENNLTDLYWGSSNPLWNNEGDIVFLQDASGTLMDSYQWN